MTYTCGGCVNQWSGVSRAHCSGCHRTFATARSFDLHRRLQRGEGICLDPGTIRTDNGKGDPVLTYRDGLWRSAREFGTAADLFGQP